jgi:hypothetical protein
MYYKSEVAVQYFIRDDDDMYRKEFLYVFGMDSYNSEQVCKVMDELYDYTKESENFMGLYVVVREIYGNELTNEDMFAYLFSFDYFHRFHECIRLFVNEKESHVLHIEDLKKSISNKK